MSFAVTNGRQCRTPSTCSSQTSGDEEEVSNNNNNNTRSINNHLSEQERHLRRQTSARSSASGGSVGSSASSATTNQYLFHSAASSGNNRHRQLGQYISSIPVPLVASSLITLLLLCLLLSECKSLMQPAQADELELPVPLRREAATSNPLQSVAAAAAAAGGGGGEEQEQQKQQQLLQVNAEPNLVQLRRELVGDLFAARALANQQHHSKRQPQVTIPASDLINFEQQDDQRPSASLETLGSLLFSSANSENNNNNNNNQQQPEVSAEQEQEARYLDGEPARVELQDVQLPANLRSSAIELDLSERRQQQASPFNLQQQQQQHPLQRQQPPHKEHVKHNLNNNNNHRQQLPIQQQQQHHHHQQQQQRYGNHDRAFDIPQIQCNNTEEGFERFACPTPDAYDRYRCIEDRLFCDGYYDCPGGEDEERVSCMYYKLFVSHIDILTNTFLTWMKKQNRQNAHRVALESVNT